MRVYVKDFKLSNKVDRDKANEYLMADNMLPYVDEDLREKLYMLVWSLYTNRDGVIIVKSFDKLSKEDIARLNKFIWSQHTDGLGPGFEEQDFAYDNDAYILDVDDRWDTWEE